MYLLKIALGPAAMISTEPNIGSRACMPGKLLSVVYAVSICHKISHQDCHDLSSKIA